MAADTTDQPATEGEPTSGGFVRLVVLHFQTVFSDILFRMLVFLLVLKRYDKDEALSGAWTAAVTAFYALPFLLFPGWAGGLADRFSKRGMILTTKVAEIVFMSLGGIALYYYTGDNPSPWAFYGAIAVYFLSATQMAFYTPNKYGILPEMVPSARLAWANGLLEMASFGALIGGAAAAVALFHRLGPHHLERISMGLVALALAGTLLAGLLPRIPAADARREVRFNPFSFLRENVRLLMSDRVFALSIMGVSYFWFLVALVVVQNAPNWGRFFLGFDGTAASSMIAVMGLGGALGSLTVGALSKRGIELGFVPLGGLGVAFFALPLALLPPYMRSDGTIVGTIPALIILVPAVTSLAMVAFCAGFYFVPLNALLQHHSPRRARGGLLAAVNFVNYVAILAASVFYWLMIGPAHLTSANVFLIVSLVTFGATVYLVTLLPEVLLGLVSTLIIRLVYRIRVLGAHNIPKEGGALLVSNHVSIVDALLIQSLTSRPVRFIVWKEIYDNPILGSFLRIMKAIPVSSDQRPRALMAALGKARQALEEGELVCVFSEGQITRAGLPLPYTRGFSHIMKNAPRPIVPIYIDGVWGSIFKYERKKYQWRWPRHLWNPVQIAVGLPLPADVPAFEMRQSVLSLSADCAMLKKDITPPVHHRFIHTARSNWRHFCVADSRTAPLKFGRTLIGSVIMARKMRSTWGEQEMVGIFLPPSVGAVLVNVAAALSGRTAVNLNYTTGADVLNYCIEKCKLKTVITSKLFLEKLGVEPPPGAVFIDDLSKTISLADKLAGFVGARLMPIRMLERFCGARRLPSPDSLITIIFSSGSTGIPKGIMLSHFNIASNIESVEKAVSLWPDDRLIGFLPFFHSFGYTVALWAQLCIGFGVVHHPNPLEAKVIGDLVEKFGVTVMIATPTFLQSYIRRIEPAKFATLEFVLTGAEKLPSRVIDGFEERFNMYVHEGYGTTECAPVVAANIDEYRSRGFSNICNRRGSVGRPVPGVVVRIVDVDSGKVLSANERGMIQVRGPNIMQGYLDMPEKTAEVLKDGWYDTGDVGFIDDDGFLLITDRLARFSKIGGEMVPHVKIEEELHLAIGATEQVFAVTSVPDEAKGEQIAVVHIAEDSQLVGIGEKLQQAGLPNLWIPRPRMFFKVDAIPVLGTGKLDLAKVKKVAFERAQADSSVAEKPAPAVTAAPTGVEQV